MAPPPVNDDGRVMASRLLVPLGMISISLGILALFVGARGYPSLFIAAGGIVLARACFATGGPPSRTRDEPVTAARFALPSVPDCPPERLRDARTLAARVVQAAGEARTSGVDSRARPPCAPPVDRARVLADTPGSAAGGSSPRRRSAVQ